MPIYRIVDYVDADILDCSSISERIIIGHEYAEGDIEYDLYGLLQKVYWEYPMTVAIIFAGSKQLAIADYFNLRRWIAEKRFLELLQELGIEELQNVPQEVILQSVDTLQFSVENKKMQKFFIYPNTLYVKNLTMGTSEVWVNENESHFISAESAFYLKEAIAKGIGK